MLYIYIYISDNSTCGRKHNAANLWPMPWIKTMSWIMSPLSSKLQLNWNELWSISLALAIQEFWQKCYATFCIYVSSASDFFYYLWVPSWTKGCKVPHAWGSYALELFPLTSFYLILNFFNLLRAHSFCLSLKQIKSVISAILIIADLDTYQLDFWYNIQ